MQNEDLKGQGEGDKLAGSPWYCLVRLLAAPWKAQSLRAEYWSHASGGIPLQARLRGVERTKVESFDLWKIF